MRAADFPATLYIGAVPQAVERALSYALRNLHKAVEACPLIGRHRFDQQAMQTGVRTGPHPCHGAFKNRQAREQNLGFEQPGDRAVEHS